MSTQKTPIFWIAGIIFSIIAALFSHFFGQSIIRDFFAQCVMLALPETFFRWRYSTGVEKKIFLISFRTERIKKDAKCATDCRDILRNSLDMLAGLAGLTLALLIIALSASLRLEQIEEYVFMLTGFSAFIIFGIDLVLCYSVTGPKMENEIVINSMKQYYDLTLTGIFCLAITLTWGLRSYSSYSIFTLDSFAGQLSLLFGLCLLFWLYWKTYVMNKPVLQENEK